VANGYEEKSNGDRMFATKDPDGQTNTATIWRDWDTLSDRFSILLIKEP